MRPTKELEEIPRRLMILWRPTKEKTTRMVALRWNYFMVSEPKVTERRPFDVLREFEHLLWRDRGL
jgi:hypothetical protein